jgi:hypothetical protein
MAIKGKSKSRGRRLVAASPRPQLMVRKKPVFARWWFWTIVGLVVAAAILLGFARAVHKSNAHKRHERLAFAVTKFGQLVEQKFPPPPASQQTGDQFIMFPTLQSDLQKLSTGQEKPSVVQTATARFSAAAKKVADDIQKIDVSKVIPKDSVSTELELLDAQYLIVQSFQVDQTIAGLMSLAATATPQDRKAIVQQVKQLATEATVLFNQGYQKIINVRTRLGVQIQTPLQPPGPSGGP